MIYINILLTIQSYAGIVSFIAGAMIVAVVAFFIMTSKNGEEKATAKKKVYKTRDRYFSVLITCIIVGLFYSLRALPYSPINSSPDQEVTIVAMQWAWKMAPGRTDKAPSDFQGNNEITLESNKHIRFLVTSADVNHNFAIYNNAGVIVAQTQAMPGYQNELDYIFKDKGEYHVLCLEYCGLAHGFMVGTIHVK